MKTDIENIDLTSYYSLQEEMRIKVITENELPEKIQFIAGTDVAYNDEENKIVGAIVVLNAETFEVLDQAVHEMEATFPYIPGLFSFREIPPLKEAFSKLKIKPDLIVCDAHGISHPKRLGMASHLGIELNIPTIGCAKKRLIGQYDKSKVGEMRADKFALIDNDEIVGYALRTQDKTNPVFVSVGHKVNIDTALYWVLKLADKYRLPETTRQADHLVNDILKHRAKNKL